MIVYDCLWLLWFMIVIEGSGWDFIVGVSATVSLSGSKQHDIFMKRWHDFMAKAVEQGLVRKAAALSGWSHFCAHCLGADVQQLQKHTEFPGESDEGQSSCSQLCLFVKAKRRQNCWMIGRTDCVSCSAELFTRSVNADLVAYKRKVEVLLQVQECKRFEYMQLWIIRSVDPGSGYVWLIVVMIFWECW